MVFYCWNSNICNIEVFIKNGVNLLNTKKNFHMEGMMPIRRPYYRERNFVRGTPRLGSGERFEKLQVKCPSINCDAWEVEELKWISI